MKVAGIAPFNHFKCMNWFLILNAVRISSVYLYVYTILNSINNVDHMRISGTEPSSVIMSQKK